MRRFDTILDVFSGLPKVVPYRNQHVDIPVVKPERH